ncbi:MAG: ABC transporter permease [Lachnospiraceae bacterium]|nr:ABC transporter permease [Lachnospiraceae bacterium]
MKIIDLIKMGLRNLSRRKARTALTVLGVVIGTISIVAMVSIGLGMSESFEKQYMQNGEMTIIRIEQYGAIVDDKGEWIGSKDQVLDDNLVNMLRGIEHIKAIAPMIETQVTLKSGKYTSWAQVRAIGKDAFSEFGFPELTGGSYPSAENNKNFVFSYEMLHNNFYYSNGRKYETKEIDPAVDKVELTFPEYNYNKNPRKKQFVLQIKDYAAMGETENWEHNYYCYMDIDYFKEIYRKYAATLTVEDRKKALAAIERYSIVYVNVDNIKNVTAVQDAIKELGYQTYSDMQYLEPLQKTSNMLQLVLGCIGGVAMFVSAINIANTMVMSIYERTREIGIMKVLGCMVKDVRKLFLFEAAMIGLIGSIIGVALSFLASMAINKYGGPIFAALMQGSGVYDVGEAKFSIIPWWLPIVASALGIAVGVLSGYLPARRATKISAIEAMKANA